jgi:hypothetical protein
LLGQFSFLFVFLVILWMESLVLSKYFSSLLFSAVLLSFPASCLPQVRCVFGACDCVWLSLVEVMSTSAARTVYRELMREARLFDRQPILKAFLKRPHSEAYEISRPIAELPEEALAQHAGYMRLAMQECLDHVPIWRVFDHLLV